MNGWKPAIRAAGTLFAAACLTAAYGAVARPGTVNYAEGQVSLDGRTIGAKGLGSTEVDPGHVLRTTSGKAEMLLTPGVYLRLGEDSAVKMLSPSLTDTRVELVRGEANVEVDLLARENRLTVVDNGANVELQKKGIYALNASPATVAVFDGKALVQAGDQSVEVKKGREVVLDPNTNLKAQKFDRDQEDPLYAWSKVRSQYEAAANASAAQMVVVNNYPGWWGGTGWYWDPAFSTWAFVPGAGYFDNPWGFGFYSPAYLGYWGGPYGYYGGYYGGGIYRGGRIWNRTGRPTFVGRAGNPGRVAAPPVGGSGLRFGGGAVARPSFRAPSMGGMRAPAMGGGGLRFGGGRR